MSPSRANQGTVSLSESLHWARLLLAHEGTAENSGQQSAPLRVLEKLRPPLCTLAGIAGFRSLLSRALALARTEEAYGLGAVEISSDGSLRGLDELGSQMDQGNERSLVKVNDGGALLIAQLLGLLFTFIGESVTLRLLHEIWPSAVFEGRGSAGETKT